MARAIGPEQYGAISFLDLFFLAWKLLEAWTLKLRESLGSPVRWETRDPSDETKRFGCTPLRLDGACATSCQSQVRQGCKMHSGDVALVKKRITSAAFNRIQTFQQNQTRLNYIYIYIDFTRSPDSFGLFELGLLNHLTRPSKYTEISRCAWNIFRYLCTCWSVVCTCVSMAEVMQPVANSSETSALTSVKGALITRGISVRLAWLTGWEQNGLQ